LHKGLPRAGAPQRDRGVVASRTRVVYQRAGADMTLSQLRTGLAVSFVFTATACAANQKILGQPVHRQVAIVVHISEEVNQADHAGGVAELVETIQDGLKDQGIDSEIYTAADDHPPPPRIELNVVYWSERNQSSRNLNAAGALVWPLGIAGEVVGPNNRMVVDCGVVLDASERRLFWQRIQAGAELGPGEAAAGGTAGSKILRQILKH
jgi:hypothetical protein